MMLLGELRVTKGHLCIRGRIGYVPQQSWIFSGSVRQNIVFGQTFDEDRYKKVIRACALEQVTVLLNVNLLLSNQRAEKPAIKQTSKVVQQTPNVICDRKTGVY